MRPIRKFVGEEFWEPLKEEMGSAAVAMVCVVYMAVFAVGFAIAGIGSIVDYLIRG